MATSLRKNCPFGLLCVSFFLGKRLSVCVRASFRCKEKTSLHIRSLNIFAGMHDDQQVNFTVCFLFYNYHLCDRIQTSKRKF